MEPLNFYLAPIDQLQTDVIGSMQRLGAMCFVLQPSMGVGSLALFDLGLRHRGRGNFHDISRTILYMSYVHEWFRDAINFPEPQSDVWKSWSPVKKRLLSRLDSRGHLRDLETKVAAADASHSGGIRKNLEL